MKTHIIKKIILILLMGLNVQYFTAQITRTIGGTGSNYSTLKLAFDAINAGTLKGIITLQIIASTTETAAITLNASGIGNANYTSIILYPTSSGNSINASLNSALITLNAASNVNFDGRVNLTGSIIDLNINNSNIGSNASTFRFVNSAKNNILRYCAISGSGVNPANGIITFGSANTGNGNSNNLIEFCNITNSNGNRPSNAILFAGSIGHENSGNIISNNNIYNFLNASNPSKGVNISSGSVNNTISSNSFYETTTLTSTGINTYVILSSTTGYNNNFSSNYIGGTAAQCGGSALTINGNFACYFCGIYATSGITNATLVQNNVISNINFTSTSDNPWDGIYINSGNVDVIANTIGSPTGNNSIVISTPVAYATSTLTNGVVSSINIIGGGNGYTVAPQITSSVNNGGTGFSAECTISNGVVNSFRIINGGSGYTSAPSIYFDGQSNMYSTSHGMIQNSSGTVNIQNNNIGSITTYGMSTYSHGFETIYVRSVTGITTFDSNLIGSLTTPNSIQTGSSSPNSLIKLDVYGIYSSSIGTTIIKNNTISNLTNNYSGTNTGSKTRGIQTISGQNTIQNNTVRYLTSYSGQITNRTAAAVIGISQSSSTTGTTQVVVDNFVNNIVSAHSAAKVDVYGILYIGPTTGTSYVADNYVYGISANSSNTLSEIDGIVLNWGMTSCYNNIVNLGSGISTGYKFNGIVDDGGTNNINSVYYNSIYLAGNVSGVTSVTAAMLNNANSTTRVYENNIFYNARSGGSGAKHYAAVVAGSSGLTINYNDYWVSGLNSALMKFGANDQSTLATIKTSTGQDLNSLNTDPMYTLAGGTNALNYYAGATLNALSISSITNDYDDLARKSTPKMGALESNNYVWSGNLSTDFGTAGNWVGGSVPPDGADITFAASPSRNCVLDQNRIIADITNAQSTYKFVTNGKQLSIKGALNLSNGAQIDASANSSIINFIGTTAQIIPSNSFLNNTIDGLVINNSNGVIMNGNLTVNQTLSLLKGTFPIGANTLTLNGLLSITSGELLGGITSNLIFGGNGLSTNLPSISLSNLTINRLNGISLTGNVNVGGVLALSSGNLNVAAYSFTFSGSSITRVAGGIDASNSGSTVIFDNNSAIILPASTFATAINNLTISGQGGITAGSDLTINAVLNLAASNPSATKGLLEMTKNYASYPGTTNTDYLDSYVLNMGATATTVGNGDVTGNVKRSTFVPNIPYSFGSQFTNLTLTPGTLPTAIQVTITIGNTAPGTTDNQGFNAMKGSAKRTYEIVPTVPNGYTSTVHLAANFHYLDSELTSSISPFNVNSEAKTVTWDYDIGGGYQADEHGRSSYDFTNNFIGLSNIPIDYFIKLASHNWRTIFSLREFVTSYYTWNGSFSSDWGNSINWTPVGVPSDVSHVIIPDAASTLNDPILASGVTLNTLSIENGGILIMGNNTLTIKNTLSGGWEDQNPNGNDPGTSKVIFSNPGTTISGNARFYDVEIETNADVTNQVGSTVKIENSITKIANGKWYASVFDNTVDYSGASQTIILPDGSFNYYHLMLSGSGFKTMPASTLSVKGNFNVSGTASVNLNATNVNANFVVEQASNVELGSNNHSIGGNIVCDGNITTSSSGGTVSLNGTTTQSIDGSKLTESSFNNLLMANINGVLINKDITVNNNLTINADSKMDINPSYKINVIGNVINNAGNNGIYIKSSQNQANGSLIFHNSAQSPVNATVEMYSKANWNLNNAVGRKYQWQYFGIPLKSISYSNVFSNCFVRKWNETGISDIDLWNQISSGTTLTSFTGYELVQSNPTNYIFSGQLENSDFSTPMSYTSNGVFPGQHIYANPYTAAIDISKIEFGNDTEASVYQFNTGNYNDWLYNGGHTSAGTNAGQYIASTKKTAGSGGIPSQIPSMQGFLVKSLNTMGTIRIPYSSVCPNAELLRAPSTNSSVSSEKIFTKIEVKCNNSSDCVWIFSDSNCKRGFDNGWDGFKISGSVLTPQIYAIEEDGKYQIDAVSDMNETNLGFNAGQENEYKLVFTHQNLANKYSNVFLIDLLENKTVDVTENNSEYCFYAVSSPSALNRFKIITQKSALNTSESLLKIQSLQESILVLNNSENNGKLMIFNLSGSMVYKVQFGANSMNTFSTSNLKTGIYIVEAISGNEKKVDKIVIR